jgi:hypothetical protein
MNIGPYGIISEGCYNQMMYCSATAVSCFIVQMSITGMECRLVAVCRVQYVRELRHCVPVGEHRKVLQPVTRTELVSVQLIYHVLFVYHFLNETVFSLSFSFPD